MDFKQFLKGIIWVGLWALLATPFIVSPGTFFPYISAKNFSFRIIMEIVFASWLILVLLDKYFANKRSWVSVSITVFTLTLAISTLLSANPFKSFWSNYERMDGFITLLHMGAYFLVLGSMLRTEKLWNWYLGSSIGMSVIMCFVGLNQLAQATTAIRVDATLGNAIYLAGYLLFHIFISLFLLYRFALSEKFKNIFSTFTFWIVSAVVVLQVITLYYTGTRGTVIGLVGGLVLTSLIIAFFEKGNKVFRKVGVGIIILIAVLIGTFFVFKDSNFVKDSVFLSRLAKVTTVQGITSEGRFMIWPMAVKGSLERPFFGWGQESFNYVFNKNYDPKMYAQEQWFDRTHNVILDWLIAGGWIGLLAYLSIYLSALFIVWNVGRHNWKKLIFFWRRNEEADEQGFTLIEKALLTGLLAGYFFHNLFVFDNLSSYMLFFMLLAYIHSQSQKPVWPSIKKISDIEMPEWLRERLLAPVVGVLLVVVIYYANILPIGVNTTLIEAMMNIDNNPRVAMVNFDKALKTRTLGTVEVREQLVEAVLKIVRNPNLGDQEKLSYANYAFNEWKKQIELTPNDTRSYIFMNYLLSGVGAFKEAYPYLEKAEQLSPNKQSIKLEIVNNLVQQGKNDIALKKAEETYNLEKDYFDAQVVYVTVLIANNKLAQAEKIMAETADKGLAIAKDRRVINVVSSLKLESWLSRIAPKS